MNIVGSLAMGLIAGWFAFRIEASQGMRRFLTTGILGGFTTFSSFSLDTALMVERGAAGLALLSVIVSIAALFLGLAMARHFA